MESILTLLLISTGAFLYYGFFLWLLSMATWIFYIAGMHLFYLKDQLHPVAKFHAYIVGGILILLDVILNIVVSIPLLEIPQWHKGEFLLSPRLERWKKNDYGCRSKIAFWLCEHLLNQFDLYGDHC